MTLFRTRARLLALLLVLLPACGGPDGTGSEGPPVMEREAFIRTYVDLREAALLHGDELSDSLRTAILQRQDVSEEELLRFAEVRGTDIAFMRDVWAEVERRLEARRVPLDSLETGEP